MKLFIVMMMTVVLANPQWSFKADTSKSSMVIRGTSTVHDWTSTIEQFTVTGTVDGDQIKGLEVLVNSESIKSGKSIMDDKTYEALATKTHPNVRFVANNLLMDNGLIKGEGQLTIGGQTRPIIIQAKTTSMPGNALQVKGEVLMRMSAFGIQPPTAMFGTITTGDEVTIEYQLLLNN